MTYTNFLEEAYRAIRDEAPAVWQVDRLQSWLVSIGEIVLHMPPEPQREWTEQYAVLLVVKYGHIHPDLARVSVRYGMTEAAAGWPKPMARVR